MPAGLREKLVKVVYSRHPKNVSSLKRPRCVTGAGGKAKSGAKCVDPKKAVVTSVGD